MFKSDMKFKNFHLCNRKQQNINESFELFTTRILMLIGLYI